jgi:hypothetical protein
MRGAGHDAVRLDHVGVVRCGKTLREERHLPHTFTFQASDDSPEQVDGDCPGWGDDLRERLLELRAEGARRG